MSDLSTGQWVGGIVGAVIGFYVSGGNPVGAAKGFALGAGIGGYIDPPPGPNLTGPTLDDKSFQASSYGVSIPTLYGSIAGVGTIIYLENNEYKAVAKKKRQGGKGGGGGGTITTTTYYATFTVALGKAMPGSLVRRIWLGGVLWYSAGSDDPDTIFQSNANAGIFRYVDGTQTEPDSRMEAVKGVGNTPSYEGTALIHIYDLELTDFGNGLAGCPVKVEIVQDPEYIESFDVFNYFTVDGAEHATRSVRCLMPFSGYRDSFSSVIYSLDNSGEYLSWVVTTRTPDDISSTSVGGEQYTSSAPGVGYSERATYCYSETKTGGLDAYSKWITDFGEYSLPDVYFNSSRFQLGSFYRIYDIVPHGVFFITHTNGFSVTLLPNRYYFWKYDDITGAVLLMPTYFIPESCTIDGAYVYFYAQSTNQIIRHSLIDYSWVDEYYLPTPASGVTAALMRDGIIYYLNAGLSDFASGEIAFTIVDTENFSSRRVHVDIDPIEGGVEVGGFVPSLSLNDNILAVSCISGDYDIKIYLINLQVVVRGPTSLADIVEAKLIESGLLPAEFDLSELEDDYVDGYRISEATSARGALGPLQAAYLFDFVEHGYTLKAIKRGAEPTITIPYQHLDAREFGSAPGVLISSEYEAAAQLPVRYHISYLDVNREYESNTQYADYPALGVSERNMQLAVVMTAEKAAQLADTFINLAHIESKPYRYRLPQIYLGVKPANVVTVEVLPGIFNEMRIESVTYTSDQRLEVSARLSESIVYQSSALGVDAIPPSETIPRIGTSTSILMDVPSVVDQTDSSGIVVGMYGASSWRGGVLMSSSDNGQTYEGLQAFTGPTTAARAVDFLSLNDGFLIDRISELTISPVAGEFVAITEDQMMTGRHYLAYGVDGRWEIMQYANADLQVDGSVVLSIFLRGLRGTEWATGLHESGDWVVLLGDVDNAFVGLDSAALMRSRLYKSVTVGQSAQDVSAFEFTYNGINLKPLSPVQPKGELVSDDWVVEWVPRTRYSSSVWNSGVEPVNEPVMRWLIDVLNGPDVVRTIESSVPNIVYTEAQQLEDFGAVQFNLSVIIYQISSRVGRGFPLEVSF